MRPPAISYQLSAVSSLTALVALAATSCVRGAGAGGGTPSAQTVPNTLSDAERRAGWRLLFDGSSTAGWRAYAADSMPQGWQAVDGALTRVARAGDIITRDKFRNFELRLEWKISPRGNSGIMYRAALGSGAIYFSAPEMQVLDDDGHADGKSELTSAGSDYGLYPAPRGVVKPVGEWNEVRLIVRGSHVEHWLNRRKIVSYELGSRDWVRKVANSKFKQWPEYGKAREGHVGLQEHGSWVAFRNIKIRVLP